MRFLLILIACSSLLLSKAQIPYSNTYYSRMDKGPKAEVILKDSVEWDEPKKVTVLAMVLPGAGQIYNKRYLKAGIVYAGIGGLIYMNKWNRDSLKKYQAVLVSKIDGDTNTLDLAPNRSEASITSDRDFYRRYRDISILGFVGLYALQIIDANVDAHLKEFKVNKDLSMRLKPTIYGYRPGMGIYNGLTVSLKF